MQDTKRSNSGKQQHVLHIDSHGSDALTLAMSKWLSLLGRIEEGTLITTAELSLKQSLTDLFWKELGLMTHPNMLDTENLFYIKAT